MDDDSTRVANSKADAKACVVVMVLFVFTVVFWLSS